MDLRINLYDDAIGFVEYVDHMGTDLTVVNAARVSLGKHSYQLSSKDEKLVKYLLSHRHTSPFEHCVITFRMKVPLFIMRELTRHRTWSWLSLNEISRRYTSENLQFWKPKELRKQAKDNRQGSEGVVRWHTEAFRKVVENCLMWYNDSLELGVCREQARALLPQSMYTELYATVNLSNLLHLLGLRTSEDAQKEIQELAWGMFVIARGYFPVTLDAWDELNAASK